MAEGISLQTDSVGQNLSKTELKNNQAIKKLRSKELENERSIKEFTRKLEVSNAETVELKEKVNKMTDLERRHTGTPFFNSS